MNDYYSNNDNKKSKKLARAQKETDVKLQAWLENQQTKSNEPFKLDPWQEEAFEALSQGYNVVVDAPTTSGKTKIIEVFFEHNITDSQFRACYTTPVKSLTNDKLLEFQQLFGRGYVGISTGDAKENLDAPIIVATLESYRNSLIGLEPDLKRKIVIFDEYHYIQDEGRGSAWEEAIILTPPECQVLLLSASLSNADEFAAWLEQLTSRKTVLITHTHRPVPLVDLVSVEGEWYLPETLPHDVTRRQRQGKEHARFHVKDLLGLKEKGLTPAIIYASRRGDTEQLALQLAKIAPTLNYNRKREIEAKLAEFQERFDLFQSMPPSLRKMLVGLGIGYHHSGLAPHVRIALEALVKEGLLDFCVATMGLSLGINFSVRSTVISDLSRPGREGSSWYSKSEVLQMTGRAGRRGKDLVGFSCWPSLKAYRILGHATRTPGNSQLRADASTFLSLIDRKFSLAHIEKFYKKSFLKFTHRNISMTIPLQSRMTKALDAELPCKTAAHEFTKYHKKQDALCHGCILKKPCFRILKREQEGFLAHMYMHLHAIGCLDEDNELTPLGKLARFFPQNGGLLISSLIVSGELNENTMSEAVQLIASLSLPRFKNPAPPSQYKFPFNEARLMHELSIFYPHEIFPEYYDEMTFEYREFNERAGWVLKLWSSGVSWEELVNSTVTLRFAEGDLSSLLFRVISYLHSLCRIEDEKIAELAKIYRKQLLREPLSNYLTTALSLNG